MKNVKYESIWNESVNLPTYAKLHTHREVDVVVIGAGITGLTTAYELKKLGKTVAVVEGRRIGAGTSGHTSAHLTTMWDEGYADIIENEGIETARNLALSMRKAIDRIEKIVLEENIECSFARVNGYYYAATAEDNDKVRETLRACQKVGLEVLPVEEAPLPFSTGRSLEIRNQAQFQPLLYLSGLANAVHGGGSYIFENSAVVDISDGKPCRVTTHDGSLTAKAVVMATHTPLGVNPLQTEVAPYRSYVIAFESGDRVPLGLYWDTSSPYYYTRTYQLGEKQVVLVGGEDRKTAHGKEGDSFDGLRDYVYRHYNVENVISQWSAQFYVPADRLPYIGPSPFQPHTYLATGFSGDGLTFGTISAGILSAQIDGEDSEALNRFSPTRMNTSALKRFVSHNTDAAKRFITDRIDFPDASRIDQLKRGEGCVVSTGLSKIAAYRLNSGEIKKFSAVCPHLKCIVQWNGIKKSFDCPCHGSRFHNDGTVIEGPSLAPLKRIE